MRKRRPEDVFVYGGRQTVTRADLLRTRRPGDAILAFSGRQTMTRSRSAEDKEARRCYTCL